MQRVLFIIAIFIIKTIFARKSVKDILLKRYGRTALNEYRRLERSTIRNTKCNLDLEFLILCKTYNVYPKFLNFKLYRSDLRNKKCYKEFQIKLLTMEIGDKKRKLRKIAAETIIIRSNFVESIRDNSILGNIYKFYFLNIIKKTNDHMREKFETKQRNKLFNLGISNKLAPVNPNDVIFNLSDVQLSYREKYLLSLGLNFNLPVYKLFPNKYFLSFEKMLSNLRQQMISNSYDFNNVIDFTKTIAYKFYYNFKPHKVFNPVINKDDINVLKRLSKDKRIIVCKPDKGRGVVIMNRKDYNRKMMNILNTDKFKEINENPLKLTLRIEDRVNYVINQANTFLKVNNKETLKNVKASGTTPGIMYGLPKIHKENSPLRPVLAAYNTATYKLAQWLVDVLTPFSVILILIHLNGAGE